MDIYKRIRKPTAKPTIPHKDKNKYARKEKHSKQEEQKKMSGGYFGHQQYIIADETKHILKEMTLDFEK